MADPKRDELQVKRRNAILVGVVNPKKSAPGSNNGQKEEALDELRGLVDTAEVNVVDTLVQARERPHQATCLGSGKLDELKELIALRGAELVIFDNNLTPAQGKKLEEETGTVIVDRSELILDIFATHAQTYEARLQVELAQLLYFRPRLKRMWTHLERIEGGIGTGRGPGEKQIETDRRLIDKRVAELKRKLREVESRRERLVAGRNGHLTVSLVGYTNAGKSTLLRALTGARVQVADKLFATLDTRTRRWEVPHCGHVLLSDTVGFVRNLPHHLVASFKSTLEEARHADLLLHVVDASNAEANQQIDTVYDVLDEIGVDCSNVIPVLNKTDNITDRSHLDVLRRCRANSVSISASTGAGLDELATVVADRLGQGFVEAEIETSVANGRLFHYLAEHAEITETRYHDSRVTFNCRIPRRFVHQLGGEDTTVRLCEPAFSSPNENGNGDL